MPKQKLTERDQVFDGFMERPFNEDFHGWMNDMPSVKDYPSVQAARDVISMFEEIKCLRKEIWRLRRIEKRYNKILDGTHGDNI